jgi:hypothetical protein
MVSAYTSRFEGPGFKYQRWLFEMKKRNMFVLFACLKMSSFVGLHVRMEDADITETKG